MDRRVSLAVLLALAARPAAAARVEVVPETAVPAAPSASLSAGAAAPLAPLSLTVPSLAATASAPAFVPAVLPASALAPSALPPASVLLPSGAPAKTAAPRRADAPPTLIQTVSAPMPELSRLSGTDSAAAAEKDFNARAQLDAPASDGTLALAASTPENAPRALRLLKRAARPAARPVSATGNLLAFGGADQSGRMMRAALAHLASLPAGESAALDFAPTAKSLEALASADGVLLARGRADGRWRLLRTGAAGFAAAAEDFDAAFLGRASSFPTAADLRASEGRAARFAIASPEGVIEWNADMPADAGAALEGTAWGRLLARAAAATGLYPRLLAARGVAAEFRPWSKTAADWAEEGRSPLAERQMAGAVIPAWMRAELPVAAAKLGVALTPAAEADVLARSKVWVYAWHSRWTYEVSDGLPDGHYDPRFGIRVMLKTDWRRLKDPETHFRVLFAHEYTHWLQEEGLVTRRYGGEIPAVAVEDLRAFELVGWEGMKAGKIGFIAEGNLSSFADGRRWARGDMGDIGILYHRGVLGGAAYEVGRIAGRPEAAWEFLNLVIAEKGGLSPRAAFERVTGVKK